MKIKASQTHNDEQFTNSPLEEEEEETEKVKKGKAQYKDNLLSVLTMFSRVVVITGVLGVFGLLIILPRALPPRWLLRSTSSTTTTTILVTEERCEVSGGWVVVGLMTGVYVLVL